MENTQKVIMLLVVLNISKDKGVKTMFLVKIKLVLFVLFMFAAFFAVGLLLEWITNNLKK